MSPRKWIYDTYDSGGIKYTRVGSRKIGVVGLRLTMPTLPPSWHWQLGPLGICTGPTGGVEAGLAEVRYSRRHSWERVFRFRHGKALGLCWVLKDRSA